MTGSFSLLGAAALAIVALASTAAAQDQPRSAVGLRAGWAEPDGRRVAGLEVALAPGWKTYWRAPGDAGVPPVFDWSGSGNVADVQVLWPSPDLFDSFGATTIGYKGAVTLPLVVTPETPGDPIRLRLALDYGVCSDICVPERAEMALDISPGDEAGRAAIAAAMARTPLSGAEAGVSVERCTLAGAGSERRFEGAFRMAAAPAEAIVVVEGPDGVWFSPAEVALRDGVLRAEAEAWVNDPALWVDRDSLRVTILGDGRGVELDGCAGAPKG